jgi:hypothetical protein
MDKKSWHWFVSGIMYRAESNKTASHTEARQRFEKEYDLWVNSQIVGDSKTDSMIEMFNNDLDKYGIERD